MSTDNDKIVSAFKAAKPKSKTHLITGGVIIAIVICIAIFAIFNRDILIGNDVIQGDNNTIIKDNTIITAQTKKPWKDLSHGDKQRLRAEIFAIFPNLLNLKTRGKWTRLKQWLLNNYAIQTASTRDILRAKRSNQYPYIYATLLSMTSLVIEHITGLSKSTLSAGWNNLPSDNKQERLEQWILQFEQAAIISLDEITFNQYMKEFNEQFSGHLE